MRLPADELEARAKRLRLILFDVDGVLTDGSVMIGADGWEAKSFSIRDGAAIVVTQRDGLPIGFLSGRPSEATTRRAAELGVTLCVQGGPDKRASFSRILAERGVADDEVGYMGDDLLDLPLIGRAGVAGAPADAVPEVLAGAHWVSRYEGGRGAVREFLEMILRARQRWDAIVAGARE